MDALFIEIAKSSPMLALMLVFWYYTRKDFTGFVNRVQEENLTREANYQATIRTLTEKVGVIDDVKNEMGDIREDVKEIKSKLE